MRQLQSCLPLPKTDKVVEFNVVTGSLKNNSYDRLCLLVPTNIATTVLSALENSDKKFHDWTIDGCDDDGDDGTIVKDLQSLPSSMFQVIRSISVEQLTKFTFRSTKCECDEMKSNGFEKKNNKNRPCLEAELLEWLIHGEEFWSTKYVVLSFFDERTGITARVPFEISQMDHAIFFEYAKSLCNIGRDEDEIGLVLQDYDWLDRRALVEEFGETPRGLTKVNENFLNDVKKAIDNEDAKWAENWYNTNR